MNFPFNKVVVKSAKANNKFSHSFESLDRTYGKKLFCWYVSEDNGQKIRHKSCHNEDDGKTYDANCTFKWIRMFDEIAWAFNLQDLSHDLQNLALGYLHF